MHTTIILKTSPKLPMWINRRKIEPLDYSVSCYFKKFTKITSHQWQIQGLFHVSQILWTKQISHKWVQIEPHWQIRIAVKLQTVTLPRDSVFRKTITCLVELLRVRPVMWLRITQYRVDDKVLVVECDCLRKEPHCLLTFLRTRQQTLMRTAKNRNKCDYLVRVARWSERRKQKPVCWKILIREPRLVNMLISDGH